ncbi:MAG TPA: TetR/AcrR family transcriptional regulator [Candidatus Sulfomarinibacteraceae bacterium]|nr:TetR/AcrR family transcriptional regulator [Candidatus Sulfomarinibacteraceae bacterium]
MPRSYRLGLRAAQIQATRERIVEAAIELYTELGISGTTIRQVGLRADVAPGTLRHHFPSREALDAAMVERLTAEAPLPDLTIFDGARSIEERLERLILATGTFFDQSARIYRMWLRERMLTRVWTETGAAYGARWEELIQAALGILTDDPDASATLRAILDPPLFERMRSGTRTTGEVCALITSVITPWFAARAADRHRASERETVVDD